MTDADFGQFNELINRMARVFGKRESDTAVLVKTYYAALRGHEWRQVERAGVKLLETGKYFPKPAEWIESVATVPRGPEMAEMPWREAKEWLAAERQRWEAEPCGCQSCVEAGVSERPLRFVPVEDGHGETRPARLGNRLVKAGRWIHGWDLFRWYQARANFYEVALTLKAGHPVEALVESLFGGLSAGG